MPQPDFVLITTGRYIELCRRADSTPKEPISSAEWTSLASDLREASKSFTDDRAYFCTSRADDCDQRAFWAARRPGYQPANMSDH